MPDREKMQIELNNAYHALLDTELLLVTANDELASPLRRPTSLSSGSTSCDKSTVKRRNTRRFI